jgi:hypothetical protein
MTREQISSLVAALGDLAEVIAQGDPADKAEIYQQLGLHLVYEPAERKVQTERSLGLHSLGVSSVSVGGLEPPRPYGHTALNRARLPIPPHRHV